MNPSWQAAVESFIVREKLPPGYLQTVEQWFAPLAEELLRKAAGSHRTLIVGISGSQGSGKSTLASLLVVLLRELMGLRSINLSLDDFYHTHQHRQQLARSIHPLLATRGVPGTHDVALAVQTLKALGRDGEVAIPRFNKAIDDRAPIIDWPRVLAPLDVVFIEGWCLCIPGEDDAALQQPVNTLENNEDSDRRWRHYVNAQIGGAYTDLYAMVDYLVMLKAPDFAKVFEWRQNQEDKLAASVAAGTGSGSKLMNRDELKRFIQHYERLTRHGLKALPAVADVVFELTEQQTIAGRLKG